MCCHRKTSQLRVRSWLVGTGRLREHRGSGSREHGCVRRGRDFHPPSDAHADRRSELSESLTPGVGIDDVLAAGRLAGSDEALSPSSLQRRHSRHGPCAGGQSKNAPTPHHGKDSPVRLSTQLLPLRAPDSWVACWITMKRWETGRRRGHGEVVPCGDAQRTRARARQLEGRMRICLRGVVLDWMES